MFRGGRHELEYENIVSSRVELLVITKYFVAKGPTKEGTSKMTQKMRGKK